MKKILIPLLLVVAIGCKMPAVFVGMSETQFKKENRSARVVEMSAQRTVYYKTVEIISLTDGHQFLPKYYYFTNGKLTLADEGFILPTSHRVPTPMMVAAP